MSEIETCIPNPTLFEGDEELGIELLVCLRAKAAERDNLPVWGLLPAERRHYWKSFWLSSSSFVDGHVLLWTEAVRCAALNKFALAGKHYRAFFDLQIQSRDGVDVEVLSIVRRLSASCRANDAKRRTAQENFATVLRCAIDIMNRRTRHISQNELAKQVSSKTRIPRETVRRFLRAADTQAAKMRETV